MDVLKNITVKWWH